MKAWNSSLVFVLLALCVVFVRGRESENGTAQDSTTQHTKTATTHVSVGASSSEKNIAEIWRRFEIRLNKIELDEAIATGDPTRWRPVMGQARHFNVPREKGIALLTQYLDHLNVEVRASAATYLFELGSSAGGPVIVSLLKEATAGRKLNVDMISLTAILHQYRYPVDPDLVFAAYEQSGSSRLLMYAQLLGSPKALGITKERLRTHGILDGALMMAGAMRINDPESMARYRWNFENEQAIRREKAAVALYRVSGERQYLDYIIAVAEAAVGLRSKDGLLDHSNDGHDAIMALQHTVMPLTTETLRKVEFYARKNGHELEASKALLGLYYFHKDYEYVDRVIMDQFTGKLSDGLQVAVAWQLAAARRTPAIEAAAKDCNQEAYEREFLRKKGRPVESWIFQYLSPAIPMDVRPL